MSVCARAYMYLCLCASCVHVCIHEHVSVCVYVRVCICVYIYVQNCVLNLCFDLCETSVVLCPFIQAFFSTVLPGEILQGHMSAKITFPQWLGNYSRGNKQQRLLQELHIHSSLK